MNGMTPIRRPGRCAAPSRDLNAQAALLPRKAPARGPGRRQNLRPQRHPGRSEAESRDLVRLGRAPLRRA